MSSNITENTYVLFDDTYLGPGYFIITEIDKKIVKFAKFYHVDRTGFPKYGVRAYEVGSVDEPEQEFRNIVFEFDRSDDLFEPTLNFASKTKKTKLSSADPSRQGKNNLSANIEIDKVNLTFSKEVEGIDLATDFIDIFLGNNVDCPKYFELCSFLCELGNISIKPPRAINIQKILQI